MTCTLVTCSALSAAAQNDRRIGVTFAFPGAVGVQWDVTDAFSLRADAGFSRTRSESTTDFGDLFPPTFPVTVTRFPSSTTVTTSQHASIGISAMWALHSRDQLKLYVAPRAGVRVMSQESETSYDLSGLPPALLAALQLPRLDEEFSLTDTSPEFGVMFGASYRLAPRFGVFVETGAEYTRGTFESGSSLESTHSTFGIKSGVGAVLYF
jgi:hypothetical protein